MPKTAKPLHVVVGGNGPLGRWVIDKLMAQEEEIAIRAVSRSGGGDQEHRVQTVAADAMNPDGLAEACEGAHVIYHTMNTPYPVWQKTLPPMMEGVIHAAEVHNAKVVYGDNLYAYGAVDPPLTEDLPWSARTRKGALRASLLKMLFAAHEAGRIRATVGMASDFYGPRVRSSHVGEHLIPRVLAGKPGQFVGDPSQPHSFCYIEDFAEDLVTLGGSDLADGETWHTRHAPPTTMNEIVKQIGAQLGQPARLMTMPPWMLRAMGLFDGMMREMHELLYQFRKPFTVDDSKFREVFRGEPTPLEAGLKRTLAWYQK